jgi:hypothetical protein
VNTLHKGDDVKIIKINQWVFINVKRNSKNAYKASTKRNTNTRTAQINKQTLNKETNKRMQYFRKKYVKVLGQNPYTLKKYRYVNVRNVRFQRKI